MERSHPSAQQNLFSLTEPTHLRGFRYTPEFLSESDQQALIRWIRTLLLTPFEFHGFKGRRRIASFGLRYDYGKQALVNAAPFPEEILDFRARGASWAGLDPASLQQMLVTEYPPGAPIGWHRDKPQFDQVLGLSLLAVAPFRFRRKTAEGWERHSIFLEPRSLYLLCGEVRRAWEHSIPPISTLRYSITLRSLEHRADERPRLASFSG